MAKKQENPTTPTEDLDVCLEDIGPARKCLTIEVPAQRIADKIESSYSRLGTDTVLPGFRKGRAPRRLLEKRFGTSVLEDCRNQLLGEAYNQAIKDHNLDVIGEPDVQDADDIKLPDSGPLKFKVEVEISPNVQLPDLEGIEIQKPKLDVTPRNIDDEIDRLAEQLGQLVDAPDATVQEDDYVKADVRILAGDTADANAVEISRHNDTWILVHGKDKDYKGHVAGILVEKLGKKLIGSKPQDSVSVSMTGPTGHENEQIRDQPITIAIQVLSAQRVEPASTAKMIETWGLESENQLREEIEKMLGQRHERQQTSAMHEQISDHLLEKVDLDLPEGLTNRQSERLLRLQALELAYTGLTPQEVEERTAQARQDSQEKAAKQLKRFFILDQAAKSLDVQVTDAEVNGRIASMAIQQNRRPEKLRQDMQRNGELEHLFLQIREQKTLDQILRKAKIHETKDTPKPKSATTTATKTKKVKKRSPKKKA